MDKNILKDIHILKLNILKCDSDAAVRPRESNPPDFLCKGAAYQQVKCCLMLLVRLVVLVVAFFSFLY